jgi:endonuclease G, mitochondrial
MMSHLACRKAIRFSAAQRTSLVVGAAGFVATFPSDRESHCSKLDTKTVTTHSPTTHDISIYSPIWPLRIIRPNPNLEICFDTRTRNAVYVQHRIVVADDGDIHKKERLRFKEDLSVEDKYRSKLSHYHLSGYDRGHLAPAADFDDRVGHELQDSYNLCNVSPQNSDMNRKIWAWLEDFTRQIARAAWKKQRAVTYVTTGPLWLPRVQVGDKIFRYNIVGIGKPPTLVMVPTHFFKVIVVIKDDAIQQFACFVVPNETSANDKTMQDYIVSWTDLETVTGLSLYPTLATDSFKAHADAITDRVRPSGEGGNQLLLTNSKSSTFRPRSNNYLQHLCSDQACVPRKQR